MKYKKLKIKKVMKEKFQVEYVFQNISATILWRTITSSQGLSEWFADSCDIIGDKYVFSGQGTSQTAYLLKSDEGKYIRFRWETETDSYFEFRIETSKLTKNVSLTIIDFAEADDKDDAIMLWDSQVDNLRRMMGV